MAQRQVIIYKDTHIFERDKTAFYIKNLEDSLQDGLSCKVLVNQNPLDSKYSPV